ncbi:MAG TPA: class I SAM-dependent methyltransferase [Terriglobales bacterium]|nr:class I SAM-dependent methyltransferase [Terriglobales bacterium]
MVEIGVYQGDFARTVLEGCADIERYYMLDPWRHLDDWNKPANETNAVFENFYQIAKSKTDFAKDKRVILRGKTTEVIDEIADGELDFAYIDGDHTLKGITIDLVRVYSKIRVGGFIGGDDFSRTVWAHKTTYEPNLVFPFAVYFAEAVGTTIYALPHVQFCLQKTQQREFRFVDLTGHYSDLTLRRQFTAAKLIKLSVTERFPRLTRLARKFSGSKGK